MGNIDKKVEHCPFRHPSSNGESVCSYSSKKCEHSNKEECKTYTQSGREYALRVQGYQNLRQGQHKKE